MNTYHDPKPEVRDGGQVSRIIRPVEVIPNTSTGTGLA